MTDRKDSKREWQSGQPIGVVAKSSPAGFITVKLDAQFICYVRKLDSKNIKENNK
jgi:hypothetical protein